jgi:RNA polymerase sigma-70 factor (ECF subfamily)
VAEPSAELVRRAQAGDRDALEQLVASQQHYVYSVAMSVLHNPDDAADLAQEAFVRLFRSLKQYNGESRFTTWLYRMVINLCRDELRRRKRQVQQVLPSNDPAEDDRDPVTLVRDESPEADPPSVLAHKELSTALRDVISQLETPYRLSLTMLYFEDMKYQDIADAMQIPLNTLKSHIRRGKERMAELIAAQYPHLT